MMWYISFIFKKLQTQRCRPQLYIYFPSEERIFKIWVHELYFCYLGFSTWWSDCVHSNRKAIYNLIKNFASRQNCTFLMDVNVLLLYSTVCTCVCVCVYLFPFVFSFSVSLLWFEWGIVILTDWNTTFEDCGFIFIPWQGLISSFI